MSTDADAVPLDETLVFSDEQWQDGPPHELFRRLRASARALVPRFEAVPEEAGYWSVTTADGVYEVSRDWKTYSSEVGGIWPPPKPGFPLPLMQSMFIAQDPPKHDRVKALFHAASPQADRRARGRDPRDRLPRPGRARGP